MEIDSLHFGRREKVLVFVHGEFAEDLLTNLSEKYITKLPHDLNIADIEDKKIDVLIITDKNKFSGLAHKYGLFLDRFFKIELNSFVNSIYSALDQYFSLEISQVGLVDLLRQHKCLDKIKEYFPAESIVVRDEYTDNEISIKTVSYVDGKQIYHGLTRDYRGETILYNYAKKNYYLLRGNLPVFEEYVTLTNVDDHGQIFVTPKFDGSLLNVTFIHKDYEVYELIKHKPLTMYSVNNGIVFIGTKNLLITTDKVVIERFMKAIRVPIDRFVKNLTAELSRKTNVVFHFELMATDEYGSQSVAYDRCFCVLIGKTFFGDVKKKFVLPACENLNCVEVKEFSNRTQVEKYINDQHNKMLNGDLSVEPEGFVIYSNDTVFKYKFPEYYIAHKPSQHFDDAFKLCEMLNGKTRYTKFRVPITSKIMEVSNLLYPFYRLRPGDRAGFIERNKHIIRRIDDEINKIRFSKKKKFKICDYLMHFTELTPENFKQYVIEFLKAK